jgi:ABC-type multidrug transport system fused ATPase/permease subunit
VIRDELSRLFSYEERHRRLLARLLLASALSLVVFVAGTSLMWLAEHGHQGGAINNIGDAAFFTATQLLTVSSSMPNPVTVAGKVVDVVMELWAIFVITAVAGSFATFFTSGDS